MEGITKPVRCAPCRQKGSRFPRSKNVPQTRLPLELKNKNTVITKPLICATHTLLDQHVGHRRRGKGDNDGNIARAAIGSRGAARRLSMSRFFEDSTGTKRRWVTG